MEIKSLILGLFFSMGVFAVKSGAGLHYLLNRQTGTVRRLGLLAAFTAGYGLVFLAVALLLIRVNLLDYLETMQAFLKSGMFLHLLLAGLLSLWGVSLLKKGGTPHKKSRAWLALVLPCPVCFSVILFAAAFLLSLYPENRIVFGLLFACYLAVSLLTAIILFGLSKGRANPEADLGRVMLFVSFYFLLTIIMVPQFGDLDKIYRLSCSGQGGMEPEHLPVLLTGVFLAFSGGLLRTIRNK
ncbi:MAG: hypothetical protein KAJ45_00055 [Desulfobulbaceae bacterium]|nr:hypothetical protein [Desulfobulbaceae bacterium]MCK5436646.1 hypothetical protein [Desulfobulbaceae bacterium]MCK5544597.1 hypothetical protein [Desulfobulbaceae bacterium]